MDTKNGLRFFLYTLYSFQAPWSLFIDWKESGQVRILLLRIYVRDGAIVEAAAFRTLPDILSRPVALVLDKPFKSLNTLLTEANLKRDITDWVGLTN